MQKQQAKHQECLLRHPLRLLTKKDVSILVPFNVKHIDRLEKVGRFPKRVQFGGNRVGWLLRDIENWILERAAERGAQFAAESKDVCGAQVC